MISLRDYQLSGVNRLRESVQQHQRSLLVAPTGAGKTRIAIRIMQGAAKQGNSCWFIVHRRELCRQTSRAMWEAKLEHGMIMAGKTRSPLPVQVATVLTAANRVEKLPPDQRPKIIIFDECHRSVSAAYQKIMDACPDAKIIGLTATPERTDGRGLGEVYRDMVEVAQMRWLIDNGYLCDYRLIAPAAAIDLSEVSVRQGDYDTGELEKAVDKPTITGDAINAYRQFAAGKRCMVFCVSIAHSEHTCAQYRAAGIPAEHIDGTHTDAEREAALDRFRRGETLILCTVQLAIEGLDIPAVEAVQQLRPTKSIIVYLQLIGRGLRPEQGKDRLIILDQVANFQRHGLPDDPREWSLEGRKRSTRRKDDDEPPVHVAQCRQCFHVFRRGPDACPQCKTPIPVADREIKQVEGQLVEVDLAAARRERKREQGASRTLHDLVALGVRRGMNKPAAWAAITIAARAGKRPDGKLFNEANKILRDLQNEQRNTAAAGNYAGAF